MIARRSQNHAQFLRTIADTRTLALLPRIFYCYLSGLPKDLLWMIEGLYLTKMFENLIAVPSFLGIFC